MNKKKNCIVAQSGGPTVAINSSLAGLISHALILNGYDTIYGSLNGITGILSEKVIDLSTIFKDNPDLIQSLKHSPSMYLGSCRYKLSSDINHIDYKKIFDFFEKYNIDSFFYIGGNDSMDTVNKLSTYAKKHNIDIKIIGIPKTIDNDLIHIDHTPGFASAAKYIATSILEMAHDTYIYNCESVLIVEIMGRNAGWLTASSVLARNSYRSAPHLVYLPETSFDKEQFINDVRKKLKEQKHIIIAVSEGIKDCNGNYISADSKTIDEFGHVCLAGTGKCLESLVKSEIGCKVRSVELNVLQRCASHIQSKTDINEAFLLGETAINLALDKKTGIMVSLDRISSSPYLTKVTYKDIDKIANKEKKIPLEWISKESNDLTNDFIEYARPLILGENQITYTNGLPNYIAVDHLTN